MSWTHIIYVLDTYNLHLWSMFLYLQHINLFLRYIQGPKIKILCKNKSPHAVLNEFLWFFHIFDDFRTIFEDRKIRNSRWRSRWFFEPMPWSEPALFRIPPSHCSRLVTMLPYPGSRPSAVTSSVGENKKQSYL